MRDAALYDLRYSAGPIRADIIQLILGHEDYDTDDLSDLISDIGRLT